MEFKIGDVVLVQAKYYLSGDRIIAKIKDIDNDVHGLCVRIENHG